jgi:hypothetical protein
MEAAVIFWQTSARVEKRNMERAGFEPAKPLPVCQISSPSGARSNMRATTAQCGAVRVVRERARDACGNLADFRQGAA